MVLVRSRRDDVTVLEIQLVEAISCGDGSPPRETVRLQNEILEDGIDDSIQHSPEPFLFPGRPISAKIFHHPFDLSAFVATRPALATLSSPHSSSPCLEIHTFNHPISNSHSVSKHCCLTEYTNIRS
jgi:hypothetical protein